ncbi:MAG: hypothetical protein ACKN9V_05710 [Pseudomonadota bacterium]
MDKIRFLFVSLFLIFQVGCSSGPSTKPEITAPDILEPVEQIPSESVSLPSPRLERVIQLLASLGYQGIGFEHEDEGTLEFVESVFSSPKTRNRKIQFVYTGLKLSYDKEQQSLTLGEEGGVPKAVRFIEKNVPIR